MRISWRHFRTDLLGIACLGVVVACLANHKWPALALAALGVALFCAITPRMKGPFGVAIGGTRVGGTLSDAQEVILKVEVSEVGESPQPEDRPPPSSRELPAD